MKHTFGALALVIALLPGVFSYLLNYSPRARKALANVEHAQQLRLGMSAQQAVQIMGQPDQIGRSYFDQQQVLYSYTAPFLASSGISITLGADSTITHIEHDE